MENTNDGSVIDNNKNQLSNKIVLSILEYVEILVLSLAIVVVLFTFAVRLCEVSGDSMNQTLLNNEKLLVSNVFYRDNVINIEIMCNYDCWQIADCQLRPYRIAGEIDSMLDGARLSGIGTLQFVSANQVIIEGNWGGLSLTYLATHGEDDKKGFENPADEEQFLREFAEMINNG